MRLFNFRLDIYSATEDIDDELELDLYIPWIFGSVNCGLDADDPMFNSTIREVWHHETA